MTLFNLNYLFKDLCPIQSLSEYLGVKILRYEFSSDTIQPIIIPYGN